MCECLDYDDGTRHTCEACVGDLATMREVLKSAQAENLKLRDVLSSALVYFGRTTPMGRAIVSALAPKEGPDVF